MALSRITKIATGSSNTFAVAFALGYGLTSTVSARVGAELIDRAIDFSTPGFMTVAGALITAGVEVVFTRVEARSTLNVDWEDGASLTDENMNSAQLQSLRLIHEALDGRLEDMTLNPIPEGHFWIAGENSNMIDGGSAVDITNAQTNGAIAAAAAVVAVAARDEALLAVQMAYGGLLFESVSGTYSPIALDRNTKCKYFATSGDILISDASSALFSVGDIVFGMVGAGVLRFTASGSISVVTGSAGLIPQSADINQLIWIQKLSATVWVAGGALANPRLLALVQTRVVDRDLTAPPGSPIYGDIYIPKATATGAWAGKENFLAVYTGQVSGSGWYFITPMNGMTASIIDEGVTVRYSGVAWVPLVDSISGDWTPTFGDITATPNMATLGTAEGEWWKTGKALNFKGHITLTSRGSMVSGTQAAIYIGDLITQAGASANGAKNRGFVNIGFWPSGVATLPGGANMYGFMLTNTRIGLYRNNVSAGNTIANNTIVPTSELTDTFQCYFQGAYRSTT